MEMQQLSRLKGKVVFVIEDDQTIGEVIQCALGDDLPLRVYLANRPDNVILMAQNIKPDLFIIDYWLPTMDGFCLYDRLQMVDELRHVPTLIISASLSWHRQELVARRLTGLEKPFDLNNFIEVICQMLN